MAGSRASRATQTRAPESSSGGLYDDFLPHPIAQLAYLLNLDLGEKLRRDKINVARWRILAALAMGDGATIGELIDRAMLRQSALSRVLMKMEAEAYVARVPRRDDARYVEVFLTDKGRALFMALDPVVRRRQRRLLAGFSPAEVQATFSLIRRLIGNMKG